MKTSIVNAGEYLISSDPDVVLTTVLGSCVAVCIRNSKTGVGGMNHFLLPQSANGSTKINSNSLIYGTYSIERLINSLIARHSGKNHLEVKVFGGAKMLTENLNVGDVNADFVETYFEKEGLAIAASDLRGSWARKIKFVPHTGAVLVAKLTKSPAVNLTRRETLAREHLQEHIPYGGLELL